VAANFASIGIQIGGIGVLAPPRERFCKIWDQSAHREELVLHCLPLLLQECYSARNRSHNNDVLFFERFVCR
jgi:hypothetical protein